MGVESLDLQLYANALQMIVMNTHSILLLTLLFLLMHSHAITVSEHNVYHHLKLEKTAQDEVLNLAY